MATLDQRLQVLIDEPRLRRVREAAASEGVPVGQWIRELIDQKLGDNSQGEKIHAFLEYARTLELMETLDQDEIRRMRDSGLERDLYFDDDGSFHR